MRKIVKKQKNAKTPETVREKERESYILMK